MNAEYKKRFEAAIKEFSTIDEYVTSLAISNLVSDYEITRSDAKKIVSGEVVYTPAKNVVGNCHYCGLPAKSTGTFGELVCSECGG